MNEYQSERERISARVKESTREREREREREKENEVEGMFLSSSRWLTIESERLVE